MNEALENLGKEYIIRRVCGNCAKFKRYGDQRDGWNACMSHSDRRNKFGYCNEHVYTEPIRKAMKMTYED